MSKETLYVQMIWIEREGTVQADFNIKKFFHSTYAHYYHSKLWFLRVHVERTLFCKSTPNRLRFELKIEELDQKVSKTRKIIYVGKSNPDFALKLELKGDERVYWISETDETSLIMSITHFADEQDEEEIPGRAEYLSRQRLRNMVYTA